MINMKNPDGFYEDDGEMCIWDYFQRAVHDWADDNFLGIRPSDKPVNWLTFGQAATFVDEFLIGLQDINYRVN